MPLLRFAVLCALVSACGGGGGSVDSDAPSGPGSDPAVTSVPTVAGAPTWYQDVAPLMADRCGGCHRDGGIAPFSVATYEDAAPWGEAIAADVMSGNMPPFYATEDAQCDIPLPFQDDLHLTAEERQLVQDWVDADLPEGDPATAAPAPMREPGDLPSYDVEIPLTTPFEVSGDQDIYECFRIPLPNAERMYLTGMQLIPDNDLVVHHVLVWTDPNDQSAGQAGEDGAYGCSGFPDLFPTQFIGGWAPGQLPLQNPEGTGTPLEAGSSLVLNIHYHPTGTSTEFDQTRVRLQWTADEPDNYAAWYMIDEPFGALVQPGPNDDGGAEFHIPPGIPDHLETQVMTFSKLLFKADATIFAISPHMHYLGTDMLVNLEHEDGSPDQCLVHTPGFRFDFQRGYLYDATAGELPVLRRGDKVRVQCMYDNSESNPFLPQHLAAGDETEPHDVYWGEETADEMCLATVGVIVPKSGWSVLLGF